MELEWHGFNKWTSSAALGCSPEYEMAIYTLCFLTRPGSCDVVLGGYHANVRAVAMDSADSLSIDTAYFNCGKIVMCCNKVPVMYWRRDAHRGGGIK